MMEKQKSIKFNMMMNVILTASNFVFPLVTYSYVARILLPEGTGRVAFVQSSLAYFSYIAALGISGYGIRECAKVRDNRGKLSLLVQQLLTINLISTFVAYIALAVAVTIVSKFRDNAILFIVMSLSMLLQAIGLEWLYTALEKFAYITVRSIIFKIIAVILTFAFVRDQNDVVVYGAITIFTTSASNVLNFFNARKYIDFKRIRLNGLVVHLKPIMVFFMSSMIISIYGQFDTVMLGFMKNDSEVGIYNAAVKMKGIVLSVSTAVTSVLIPRMSVYFSRGEKNLFNDLLLKSVRVTCLFLIPLSAFVAINATDVLLLVCGEKYVSATPTLVILMLCCVALSLTNLLGNQVLIPTGKEKRYSMSVFIGMWINLTLNTLWIPSLASVGAAIATLTTETFNVVWMGLGCKDEVKYVCKHLGIQRYLISLGISSVLCFALRHYMGNLSVFLRLVLCTLLMFGVYYSALIIQRDPLIISMKDMIKKLMKKRYNK